MEMNLAGKTVVVTGGSSNIGRAIVIAYAKEKANVVIADIDQENGLRVIKEANSIGGKAIFCKTSVIDYESVSTTVKKVITEFKTVDILVNNVGWSKNGLFVEKPRSDWDKEIDLNLRSVFNCTRAVVSHMMEKKYGKIINMSSDGGRIGGFGLSIYSSCKAGVIAFTKAMARELAKYNINVNAICPGFIPPLKLEHAGANSVWKSDTGSIFNSDSMDREIKSIPLKRVGTPQDIAMATLFLSSDVASYITGQTLSVDGGWVMI